MTSSNRACQHPGCANPKGSGYSSMCWQHARVTLGWNGAMYTEQDVLEWCGPKPRYIADRERASRKKEDGLRKGAKEAQAEADSIAYMIRTGRHGGRNVEELKQELLSLIAKRDELIAAADDCRAATGET